MTFDEKFFGFYKTEYGDFESYSDNLTGGAFADWRHWLWILTVPILATVLFKYIRRYPEKGRRLVVIFSGFLLFGRFSMLTFPVFFGGTDLSGRIIPFHMCAVLGVIVPFVVWFDIKPLQQPFYVLAIMGSVATIAFGEYFTSSFTNYYFYEGIISHTLLMLIPLVEIARGNFALDIKKSWTVPVAMLILMAWATLANTMFFNPGTVNYMYLKRSGFPDGFAQHSYFWIYVLLFILVFSAIYGIPTLYRHKKSAR